VPIYKVLVVLAILFISTSLQAQIMYHTSESDTLGVGYDSFTEVSGVTYTTAAFPDFGFHYYDLDMNGDLDIMIRVTSIPTTTFTIDFYSTTGGGEFYMQTFLESGSTTPVAQSCSGQVIDSTFGLNETSLVPLSYGSGPTIYGDREGDTSHIPFRLYNPLTASNNYGVLILESDIHTVAPLNIPDSVTCILHGWYINLTPDQGINCDGSAAPLSINENHTQLVATGRFEVYDLLGRKLDKNSLPTNQILIRLYSNGFSEKFVYSR
jgi:hypothetical protein